MTSSTAYGAPLRSRAAIQTSSSVTEMVMAKDAKD
jgi:hypothetical protein